jgi:hypothetical protein
MSVGAARRWWHCYGGGSPCWRRSRFRCVLASEESLSRRAEGWAKVAFAILLLHHTNSPLPQVNWRTLGGLQERIRLEELSWCWTLLGILHQTLCDHVFEDGRESIALRQSRRRLENDLLEQIEDTLWTCSLVVIFAIDAEWEFANGQFHQRQANTPDVTLDCVWTALDSLWCHVGASADEGVCHTVLQFTAYTEVAKLDLTLAIDQDVRRLDVTVHDPVCLVEVREASKNGLCDFAQNIDSDWTEVLRYAVKRAGCKQSVFMVHQESKRFGLTQRPHIPCT